MSSNKKNSLICVIRSTFIEAEGRLRFIWQVSIALISWYALTMFIAYAGSHTLMHLLDSWGINASNLHLAPAWVQYLVSYQTNIYHAISSVATIIAGTLLMRRRSVSGPNAGQSITMLAIGFLVSIVAAAALTYVFVLTDSLRQYTGIISASMNNLIMLVISMLTASAECVLAFGYITETAAAHNRKTSFIIGTAMFFAMNIFSASDAIGLINALLTGILLCSVSQKYGIAPAIGLRTGWLWATTSLISFSAGDNAILRLYTVSESLLTGGETGLSSGLAVTLLCVILLTVQIVRLRFSQK